MENPADHRYVLGIGDVVELLDLSATTVRRLTNSGRLPSIRTPGGHRRYRRVDVDAFRTERLAGATSP